MSGGEGGIRRKVPIAAKVPPADRQRIKAAAEYLDVSCSRLIGEAASERARRVLAGTALEGELEQVTEEIDAKEDDDEQRSR